MRMPLVVCLWGVASRRGCAAKNAGRLMRTGERGL